MLKFRIRQSIGVSALAAVLLLAGCGTLDPGGSGRVRMAVLWPRNFSIQEIPAGTQSIAIAITGIGLTGPIERSLSRSGPELQTVEIELPPGNKQVSVKALSGKGEILAENRQDVVIRSSQTSRLEMSLTPVVQPTPTPLPDRGSSGGAQGGQPTTGQPEPGGSGTGSDPAPTTGVEPTPDQPASPPPSPVTPASPTTTTGSSGSSGGSGGGGSGPVTATMTVSANPNPISGPQFPTELTLSFSNAQVANAVAANPGGVSWTCTDPAAATGCGSFEMSSSPLRWVWHSPPAAGGSGPFTLSVVAVDNSNNHTYTGSVSVTVTQGSGNATVGNGGFDSGEAGG